MCGVSGRRMGLSQARGELSNQSCWSCLAPVGPLLYRPEQLHMLLRDPVAGHSWPGIMDGQPEPWDTVNLMSLFELSPFVCSQYFLVASSIYKYVRTTGLLPYNQPAGGMLPNASKPQTKSYHTETFSSKLSVKQSQLCSYNSAESQLSVPYALCECLVWRLIPKGYDTVLGQDTVNLLAGSGVGILH